MSLVVVVLLGSEKPMSSHLLRDRGEVVKSKCSFERLVGDINCETEDLVVPLS